jgi:hypothetical protein
MKTGNTPIIANKNIPLKIVGDIQILVLVFILFNSKDLNTYGLFNANLIINSRKPN